MFKSIILISGYDSDVDLFHKEAISISGIPNKFQFIEREQLYKVEQGLINEPTTLILYFITSEREDNIALNFLLHKIDKNNSKRLIFIRKEKEIGETLIKRFESSTLAILQITSASFFKELNKNLFINEQISNEKSFFECININGKKGHKINFEHFLYAQADGSITNIFYKSNVDATIKNSKTFEGIGNFYTRINNGYLSRIHRAYLVNLDKIENTSTKENKKFVHLEANIKLPVSRRRRKQIEEAIKVYKNTLNKNIINER